MLHPNFSIHIGSKTLTPKDGEIVSVRVKRSMGLPIDSCEVRLATGKDLKFGTKDDVRIKLGYDGQLVPVFAGSLDKIEHEINGMTLTALGPCAALLRLKTNKVYLNQTAGKIIRDLAKEANVKVKEASDGINLPMYVVDNKINAFKHVLKLAQRCNFDVYSDEDRKLIFKEWTPGETHGLVFGKDIVSAKGQDTSPRYASTRIRGESPSSFKGSDTSTWLTKQEVKGEAGGTKDHSVLTVHDPAIRDRKTAEAVAKARLKKIKYSFILTVDTVGRPEINLGEGVSIKGVPRSAINGDAHVTGVEHYISKTKGFTTIIRARKEAVKS